MLGRASAQGGKGYWGGTCSRRLAKPALLLALLLQRRTGSSREASCFQKSHQSPLFACHGCATANRTHRVEGHLAVQGPSQQEPMVNHIWVCLYKVTFDASHGLERKLIYRANAEVTSFGRLKHRFSAPPLPLGSRSRCSGAAPPEGQRPKVSAQVAALANPHSSRLNPTCLINLVALV